VTTATHLGVSIRQAARSLRVLDFDTECRPIAWYGGDFVTKQPTAIAWKLIGSNDAPEWAVIGESFDARHILDEEAEMLMMFVEAYEAADVVTGHFIRSFDLPLLNGALIRLGLGQLGDKLTQDTKLDLARAGGVSKSQENLGAMFELEHPKIPMNTAKWARANMLLPDGIEHTKQRVIGDVLQHIELRGKMIELGLLAAPSAWSAAASGSSSKYQP
jgi:hypothetical protein